MRSEILWHCKHVEYFRKDKFEIIQFTVDCFNNNGDFMMTYNGQRNVSIDNKFISQRKKGYTVQS